MEIVSFANQKGGVGKSTLTHLICKQLASEGKRIRVVECDPQGSLSRVFKAYEEYEEYEPPYDLVVEELGNVGEFLSEMEDDVDFVFLDLPGMLELENVRKVLLTVDHILVPIKPGEYDIHSTVTFLKQVLKIKELREERGYPLNFFTFLNMAKANSRASREAQSEMENNGIPILENNLRDLKLFGQRSTDFEPVFEEDEDKLESGQIQFRRFYQELKSKIDVHE